MKRLSLWLLPSLALLPALPAARADCDRIPRCELVWADEFDGSRVDPRKWAFQRGDGSEAGLPRGWGNNELQWYQADNATVADGFLTITAREEPVSGLQYTSARLRTRGRADWRYGRMEMRARMPIGRGLWAAFWMLPTDEAYGGWAASGEIDIVEYLGHQPGRVHGTIHYGAPWPGNASSGREYDLRAGSFADDFHVFAIEWEPAEIRWYVDGVQYATQSEWFSSGGPYPAPFDRHFHLLLNLAVGGDFPGSPDSSTEFPQQLVVDYVRVYQAAAAKGTQVSAASLLFDRPEKMRKVRASLSTPFENRARRNDLPTDRRSLSCSVRARGASKGLAAKGKLRLRLVGVAGGEIWVGPAAEAALDGRGEAGFPAALIEELVAEAAVADAALERFEVTYVGAGGKKVARLDLDCWQMKSDDR